MTRLYKISRRRRILKKDKVENWGTKLILTPLSKASHLSNMEIRAEKWQSLENGHPNLSNGTSLEPNEGWNSWIAKIKKKLKKKDKSYEIHKNWVVVLSSDSNFTIIMKIGSKKLVFSWSRSNYIQSVTNYIPRSCLDWMLWSTQDWQKSPCKTHFVWTNQLPRQVIFGTVQKELKHKIEFFGK